MAGCVPSWEHLLKVLRTAEGTVSRAVARGDCGCLQPLSSPYRVRVEKPKHKSCFSLHSPRFASLLILCVLSAEQCNCNLDLAKKLGQFQVSLQRLVAGLWSQGLVDKTTFFFFFFCAFGKNSFPLCKITILTHPAILPPVSSICFCSDSWSWQYCLPFASPLGRRAYLRAAAKCRASSCAAEDVPVCNVKRRYPPSSGSFLTFTRVRNPARL